MKKTLWLREKEYSTQKCCMVMGILNATSDSFYAKSRVSSTENAVERALKMIDDGADILDLGSESSRPGAEYVSAETEIEKLVPIVSGIRKYNSSIPISIDTRKKIVMEECLNAGADILNDISSLEDDEKMISFVSESKIPVILMHKRGSAKNMMNNTHYENVFREVQSYLYSRADWCVQNGIERKKIIFDPGIGFGKDLKSNLQLVRNCGKISSEYADGSCLSVMALSRKTMIQSLTGKDAANSLAGTLTANAFSVMAGSDIVRVHDVAETVDMINVLTELLRIDDE